MPGVSSRFLLFAFLSPSDLLFWLKRCFSSWLRASLSSVLSPLPPAQGAEAAAELLMAPLGQPAARADTPPAPVPALAVALPEPVVVPGPFPSRARREFDSFRVAIGEDRFDAQGRLLLLGQAVRSLSAEDKSVLVELFTLAAQHQRDHFSTLQWCPAMDLPFLQHAHARTLCTVETQQLRMFYFSLGDEQAFQRRVDDREARLREQWKEELRAFCRRRERAALRDFLVVYVVQPVLGSMEALVGIFPWLESLSPSQQASVAAVVILALAFTAAVLFALAHSVYQQRDQLRSEMPVLADRSWKFAVKLGQLLEDLETIDPVRLRLIIHEARQFRRQQQHARQLTEVVVAQPGPAEEAEQAAGDMRPLGPAQHPQFWLRNRIPAEIRKVLAAHEPTNAFFRKRDPFVFSIPSFWPQERQQLYRSVVCRVGEALHRCIQCVVQRSFHNSEGLQIDFVEEWKLGSLQAARFFAGDDGFWVGVYGLAVKDIDGWLLAAKRFAQGRQRRSLPSFVLRAVVPQLLLPAGLVLDVLDSTLRSGDQTATIAWYCLAPFAAFFSVWSLLLQIKHMPHLLSRQLAAEMTRIMQLVLLLSILRDQAGLP